MNSIHLTEIQLQICADKNESIDLVIKEHLAHCPDCQIKVENYRMINASLKEMPSPAFDFDLAETVSAALVVKKAPGHPSFWLFMIAIVSLVVAVIAGMHGRQVGAWFMVLPKAWAYLLVVPASVLLLMQSAYSVVDYQRKINKLMSKQ